MAGGAATAIGGKAAKAFGGRAVIEDERLSPPWAVKKAMFSSVISAPAPIGPSSSTGEVPPVRLKDAIRSRRDGGNGACATSSSSRTACLSAWPTA